VINDLFELVIKLQEMLSKKLGGPLLYFCGLTGLAFLVYRFFSLGGFPQGAVLPTYGLVLSFTAYITSLFFHYKIWNELIAAYKNDINPKGVFVVHFLSQIVKYIPGGIWNYLGRNALSEKRLGIPAGVTVRAAVSEILAVVIAMLACSSLVLAGRMPGAVFIFVFGLVLIIAFFMLRTLLSKVYAEFAPVNMSRLSLRLFFWACLCALAFGASYVLLFPAGQYLEYYVYISGTYVFCYIAGFISPFPAGLGIRDGLMVLLLAGRFGEPVILSLTLVVRIISILGDLTLFMLAVVLNRFGKLSLKG
jgi:uncharacterized membrane protein YbhN (UPF0104 family)